MSKNTNKEGNTNRSGEGQLYDKIMRENLQQLFLPLIAEQLNYNFKSVQPLPDKQPTTVIRETDAFLLVETDSEKEPKFILHLEFESKDDKEMIYRISEYHGIGLRKYRLPIKHVVVYLGETPPQMRTSLEQSEIFDGFILVNARDFSPNKWLLEDQPSKIIMAILGDYQKKNAEIIIQAIFDKLRQVCSTQSELKKYIKQLIIISRMRNLENLTIKISGKMPITIDIEKDYLYNLGLKAGEEKLAEKLAEIEAKAKAASEKLQAELEAKLKAEVEKAKMEAEKKDKKTAIQKMKATNRFSDDEIMDFLSLEEETFKSYLKEIQEETKVAEENKSDDNEN